MLAISIGKIIKNKGLFLCLFLACVFSVALFASIPVYENAINKRMLQRELSEFETQRLRPPIVHNISFQGMILAQYMGGSTDALDSFVHNEITPRFLLPITEKRLTLSGANVMLMHVSPYGEMANVARSSMVYTRGFFEHVELVAGRFPVQNSDLDVIEVVVSEIAAVAMPIMLDSMYALNLSRAAETVNTPDGYVRVRVVGVVREQDPNDLFWRIRPLSARNMYTTHEAFINTFLVGADSNFIANWESALDHTAIEPDNVLHVLEVLGDGGHGSITNLPILRRAIVREAELGPFLWVLQTPILALLIFFIIMLSGLVLEHDKIEIALLYSRGAGKGRIFVMYALQMAAIAIFGLAVGIPLSLLLCLVLGSSAGFLEFAGRAPLDVAVTTAVIRYAVAGAGLFVVSILVPILLSPATGIVTQRRAKVKRDTKPFFERYCLDVILLGISIYGYFSYQNLTQLISEADFAVPHYSIDPLIFLVATFFFVGSAMFFTRLYPYIIRLLFGVGRSFWSAPIYASLSAARSRPRSRYIMLFIIMTTSIGLFASAAARTINQNELDRAMYNIGADLVIEERWSFVDPDPTFCPETGLHIRPPDQYLFFIEPPFERFGEANGVSAMTKVYRNDRTVVRTLMQAATLHREMIRPVAVRDVNIMAIYPDEFAQVAWWRSDLFDYHFYHKMNAMSLNPNVVLLSRGLMERLRVAHGDEVRVTWANNTHEAVLYVYDAVDFFPTFHPIAQNGSEQHLIVMNLELVRAEFRIEPYEIWIAKESGASAYNIIESYLDSGISLQRTRNASTLLAAVRNDPIILSMNGFLTLSFMMILAITLVSFLVFWTFELQSRRLQISIMRSMGMSRGDVSVMLLWEQVLISLLPLIVGFVLGEVGSSLFVPMFELNSDSAAIPFKVFRQAGDSLLVGAIISGSILVAIAMLWYMVAKINVSQTLKLGEE